MAVATVLMLVWSGALVVICRGVRHNKVVIMSVMLLVSNMMVLANAGAEYQIE